MIAADIATRVQKKRETRTPQEVARQSLLILNSVDDPQLLENDDVFEEVSQEVEMRFQAVSDQHAAMTCELEQLACSDPRKFSPEQIWILVRAIKVQSQVLQLFSGNPGDAGNSGDHPDRPE